MAGMVGDIVSHGVAGSLVKSPDEVLENLLKLGLPVGEAAALVRSYYASFHAVKSVASSASSSVVSLGSRGSAGFVRSRTSSSNSFLKSSVSSWRKPLNSLLVRSGRGVQKPGGVISRVESESNVTMDVVDRVRPSVLSAGVNDKTYGYCYLAMIDVQYQSRVATLLGPNPRLSVLIEMPMGVFVSYSRLVRFKAMVDGLQIHIDDVERSDAYSFVSLVRSCASEPVAGSLASVVACRCSDESAQFVNQREYLVGGCQHVSGLTSRSVLSCGVRTKLGGTCAGTRASTVVYCGKCNAAMASSSEACKLSGGHA